MRAALLLAMLAVIPAVGGCDRRPNGVIVCHNANCAHATDPFKDATLESLDDSLALRYLDHPVIDGMELDTVWDRANQRCMFAHDFEHPDTPSGLDAADRVAAYLAQPTDFVSWNGNYFFVKIELKPQVTRTGEAHSDDDFAQHYACVFDMADRMIAAAVAHGRDLELAFESEATIIRGIPVHPRWYGKEPQPNVHVRLIANVQSGGLSPSDLASLRGDTDTTGIDILSFHASRIPDGQQGSYLALEVSVMLWMLDSTLETFYAMEAYQPDYVTTNEAVLMRRWMEE